jgi:hypothetical protein
MNSKRINRKTRIRTPEILWEVLKKKFGLLDVSETGDKEALKAIEQLLKEMGRRRNGLAV